LALLAAATMSQAGCSSRTSATHLVLKPVGAAGGEAAAPSIKALGRIQPVGGVVSVAGTPGARIAKMLAREGASVALGDELFRLDTYDVLEATCVSIRAQLDEAKELLAVEAENTAQLQGELAVEEEQVQVLDPLDVEAQQEKLNALEVKLAHEEREARRLNALRDAKSSLVSDQQLEGQGLLVEGARAERNAARALLRKLKAGHALAVRKLALQKAQIGVASRKSRLAARTKSLAASLAAAERQRDQAIVRAPTEGRVLMVLMREGESIGNQPVLQLADTSDMCVVADVSDLYIRELRQARKARAVALGDTLEGTISPSDIGRMIGKATIPSLDPTVDADRRVVEVKVRLDPASSRRAKDLTNMQVDVVIQLEAAGGEAAGTAGAETEARAGR
jgi:HlyD family secretion protein